MQAIQSIKEFVGFLWAILLTVLLLLLVALPESTGDFVRGRLGRAGVSKFSFAGVEMEMKKGLEKTTEKLEQAQQVIASLTADKERLSLTLAEAEMKVKDSELLFRIRETQKQLGDSTKATVQLQESLDSTVAESKKLLKQKPTKLSGQAFCYQEDTRKDGPTRYSVHCHAQKAVCEEARGPAKDRRQTGCEAIDLSTANWTPMAPGWLGSTYQFGRTPFSAPFPQLIEN